MLWRFLVKIINKNGGVRTPDSFNNEASSTTPKAAYELHEDKFMQQPPKSKSPYGDKDHNVYCIN